MLRFGPICLLPGGPSAELSVSSLRIHEARPVLSIPSARLSSWTSAHLVSFMASPILSPSPVVFQEQIGSTMAVVSPSRVCKTYRKRGMLVAPAPDCRCTIVLLPRWCCRLANHCPTACTVCLWCTSCPLTCVATACCRRPCPDQPRARRIVGAFAIKDHRFARAVAMLSLSPTDYVLSVNEFVS